MKKFNLVFVILAVFIIGAGALLLSGYQSLLTTEVRASGGSYTEGIVGTPRFINPVLAQSSADRDLTKLVFSSLLTVQEDGSITYHLADDLVISPDGKTYTLHINPNAYFSDGTKVTADDVVFTIQTIQDPLIKSPLFANWIGVEVTATEPDVVTFSLNQPYPDFIHDLDIGVLPALYWEDIPHDEFTFNRLNIEPVGSGPYTVSHIEYNSNGSPSRYVLVPNKDYVTSPYISSITVNTYDNDAELIDAYQSREVDGMYGISARTISDLNLKRNDIVHHGPLSRTFGIFFNTENNKEMLDNETRVALSYGVSRKGIVEDIFNGYATAIDTPVSQDSDTEYNPQKATTLLQEAGWTTNTQGQFIKVVDEKPTLLSFTLAVPQTAELQKVAQYIQQDFREIGVEMKISLFEERALVNEVIRSRDYDAVLFGYVLEKPSDLFAFWHSSQTNDPGLNITMYSNSTVDRALSNIRTQQEREDDVDVFARTWEDDMPALILYRPEYIYVAPEHFELPHGIKSTADRFNHVADWYQRTRHVWNFLIEDGK